MLKVLERCTILRVQSWESGSPLPGTLESALSLAWPSSVGLVATGRCEVICVGPTDWLVLSSTLDPAPLLQTLSDACSDSTFRFTDVSSALARLHLSGPHARTCLSKSCSLDLDPTVFLPGRSARARFAGMPVIVCCREPSRFELIVVVSYREYLVSWLADAVLEFESATI